MALCKPENRWWMPFNVNGVLYRHSVGTKNKKTAKASHGKIISSIAKGKWLYKAKKRPRYTFRELAVKCEDHANVHRSNYAKVAKRIVSCPFIPFSDLPLVEFSQSQVPELQTDLAAAGKRTSYINRTIVELKTMIFRSVQWGMTNPGFRERVRDIRMLNANNRLRFLSLHEIQRLFKACIETSTGHNGNARETPHLLSIITSDSWRRPPDGRVLARTLGH